MRFILRKMKMFKNNFLYFKLRIAIYKYLDYRSSSNLMKIKLQWRDKNRHNFTTIDNKTSDTIFPLDKIKIGRCTYGPLRVISYGSSDEYLNIGSFCSIASGVKFILGGEHKLNKFSTYPFRRIIIDNNEIETFSKGDIILEDDVWIGTNSLILSGVKLSRGTVVAAGSVVTKSTDPYSIIGGNPARLIKKRFNDDIIENLLNIDYNILTDNFVRDKIGILEAEIDERWFENL